MKDNNDKKEDFFDRFLLKRWSYIILTIVFMAFSLLCFKWGHELHMFNKEYTINHDLFGTYGDFFGGVLGTIFTLISVLLVVRTFKYQQLVTKDNQLVTKDNQELQKAQQFNDLFFELIHLYQAEVKELNCVHERVVDIQKDDVKEDTIKIKKKQIQYSDKDFFDAEKKLMQKKYRHLTSYKNNIQRTINYYILFYTNNRSKIAAYFRTLYRIFELIDKTNLINEERKKEYAKIIRAQLTESELFFLRYNAMTIYGHQFIAYLNKYRVLKHLPAFELLEFKDWWKNMNIIEREGINMIFHAICESLKDVFAEGESTKKYQIDLFHPTLGNRYRLSLTLMNLCDFNINMKIDKSSTNMSNEFLGFLKLDDKRIQQLFDCFLKEIFLFSNFNKYNKSDDIQTYSSPIITKDNSVIINSGIKNIKNNPLIFKYSNSCPSTK